jgi:hypothetical protein
LRALNRYVVLGRKCGKRSEGRRVCVDLHTCGAHLATLLTLSRS